MRKDRIAGLIALLMLLVCGAGWDYSTRHGVKVVLGQQNRPTIDDVEKWTNWAIVFWNKKQPEWHQCIAESMKDLTVRFLDKHIIELPDGTKALAYMWYKKVEVGLGHPKAPPDSCQISRLYIHELHHVVIWWCFGDMDNDSSHQFMTNVGAGGGPCPWK